MDKPIERQEADPALVGWDNPRARLMAAFERDEFELYCQPILALEADAQAGARYPMGEVLVRMREEERAMLPPGEFLPVLEHYGMLPQLDRWVLRRVLERLRAGSRLGCYSMNVSRQTLEDAGFPGYVKDTVRAAGVPVDSLVFEIDEPDILEVPAQVSRFVAAMKVVGAGVLVDSFGRRAVSFAPLKAAGAHFVKVDGAIVRKLVQSESARAKLQAIVEVGRATGLEVIGECVEEQEVLGALKRLGAGYAQGFGIARPQPIDAFAA